VVQLVAVSQSAPDAIHLTFDQAVTLDVTLAHRFKLWAGTLGVHVTGAELVAADEVDVFFLTDDGDPDWIVLASTQTISPIVGSDGQPRTWFESRIPGP
jgi:hypothetical protein